MTTVFVQERPGSHRVDHVSRERHPCGHDEVFYVQVRQVDHCRSRSGVSVTVLTACSELQSHHSAQREQLLWWSFWTPSKSLFLQSEWHVGSTLNLKASTEAQFYKQLTSKKSNPSPNTGDVEIAFGCCFPLNNDHSILLLTGKSLCGWSLNRQYVIINPMKRVCFHWKVSPGTPVWSFPERYFMPLRTIFLYYQCSPIQNWNYLIQGFCSVSF